MDFKPRRRKKQSAKSPADMAKSSVEALKNLPAKLPGNGSSTSTSAEPVPRITNESIAAHREEVLGSARKYIYPLRHSRHRVVKISLVLFASLIITFFVGTVVALYKMQNTSTFMYSVTRIIPFPVAKAGNRLVSYDSYLFQLRHYIHYYESQQGLNVNTEDGKRQLQNFKQRSMDQAVSEAYVKELAAKNNISVSNKEVNDQVALVRTQNRLGSSDEVFRNVLREFWGWSVADFKRELKNELLEQKVIAKLDTNTTKRANDALAQLQGGVDFATLAAQVSDDNASKVNGGEYGFTIDRSSRDISPQAVDALYQKKAGEITGVINAGYYLEIDKVLEVNGDKLRAAHITFNFDDIDQYLAPVQKAQPTRFFLHI